MKVKRIEKWIMKHIPHKALRTRKYILDTCCKTENKCKKKNQ